MRAINPKIRPRLKILEPTILDREISLSPLKAAVAVTKNSGNEVPRATTVRPITSSESLNFLAMAEALPTIQFAPNQRSTALRRTKMIFMVIVDIIRSIII
jgi:hypothetical protein